MVIKFIQHLRLESICFTPLHMQFSWMCLMKLAPNCFIDVAIQFVSALWNLQVESLHLWLLCKLLS
jgi:hypothetical protein